MTFLTFRSTNFFNRYAIHFAGFNIIVKLLVNAVKLIAFAGCFIIEINLAFAVTVNTPSHTQIRELSYFRHFLNISVTGLAILLTHLDMLAMIEINVIGKIVDFNPLNWLTWFVVNIFFCIPTCVSI